MITIPNFTDQIAQRPKPVWARDSALNFTRKLSEALLKVGFATGLTGSVLLSSDPEKQTFDDLDVIIYPMKSCGGLLSYEIALIDATLSQAGLVQMRDIDQQRAHWSGKSITDCKRVAVWSYEGLKVDVFYLT